jgi:hypothetical protein
MGDGMDAAIESEISAAPRPAIDALLTPDVD